MYVKGQSWVEDSSNMEKYTCILRKKKETGHLYETKYFVFINDKIYDIVYQIKDKITLFNIRIKSR